MSDFAPVSGPPGSSGSSFERLESAPGRRPEPRLPAADRPERPVDRAADRAEFSDRARLLSKLASLPANPPVRQDLIDSIRAQIASGVYETEEKLDAAVQALAEEMSLEVLES